MANLQDAFIEIINYYGFKISKQLVSKLQAAGKLQKHNKKTIIGFHFHNQCCVEIIERSSEMFIE